MSTKLQKWGNSLAMRLPKEVANKFNLQEGSEVKIVSESKSIVIKPIRIKRKKTGVPTLKELLKGITKHNKHREIDWGKSVGREIW